MSHPKTSRVIMYFIAKSGSELEQALRALYERARLAQRQAIEWRRSQGFISHFPHSLRLRTGIIGIEAEENPDPKQWKRAKWLGTKAYIPKQNSKAAEELAAFPTIEQDELTKLLSFVDFDLAKGNGQFITTYCPGWGMPSGVVVLHYPDEYDHPIHPDLIEITRTEVRRLQDGVTLAEKGGQEI